MLSQASGPYDQLDFTYDSVGNRISRAVDDGSTITTDSSTGYGYSYNAAGRTETFSIFGVVQAEYVYNALGQQVVRRLTQVGQTIHSVHDVFGNRIAEYDYDPATNSKTLLREYVWLEGVSIAVVDGTTDAIYFIRTDQIGRPVFATDATGAKVWEATYLPFGGVDTSTGTNIDLRFPGQWFQSESGLHQNWMREYGPTTGRYMQANPLGLVDGASVYGYQGYNKLVRSLSKKQIRNTYKCFYEHCNKDSTPRKTTNEFKCSKYGKRGHGCAPADTNCAICG